MRRARGDFGFERRGDTPLGRPKRCVNSTCHRRSRCRRRSSRPCSSPRPSSSRNFTHVSSQGPRNGTHFLPLLLLSHPPPSSPLFNGNSRLTGKPRHVSAPDASPLLIPTLLPTFCVSFALFPAGLLCRTGCREEGGEGGRATHASSSAPYMNEMCDAPAPEQPYHSNLRSSPHNLVHSMRCGAFSEVYMRNCPRPRRPLSPCTCTNGGRDVREE